MNTSSSPSDDHSNDTKSADKSPGKISILKEYIQVIRPLSLTCALISTLITTSVVSNDYRVYLSKKFIRSLIMSVFIQLGANLTNTYFDFVNGVDTVDIKQRAFRLDKGLMNRAVSTSGVLTLIFIFYTIGITSVYSILLRSSNQFGTYLLIIGVFLSVFYTAYPIGLKYKALGDITIFVCFGPILMQCISIILTDSISDKLYLYCIPIGFMTEAILHANNSRDIETDAKTGAITLAYIIGIKYCYYLYFGLLLGAYVSTGYISLYYHRYCLVTVITVPIAINLIKSFKNKQLECLPQMTSKLYLPFGFLMWIGIVLSNNKGILQ